MVMNERTNEWNKAQQISGVGQELELNVEVDSILKSIDWAFRWLVSFYKTAKAGFDN